MVTCERCHRKFGSYTALDQHYDSKHPNVRKPPELEQKITVEREADSWYKARGRSRGPSWVKLSLFLIILIVAVAVTGYVALSPRGGSEQSVKRLGVGAIAPDFGLPDTTGATFRLSQYRGKSNVLLFFNEGLSCSPCLRQMRDLDELNRDFTDLNIVVVSITADPLNLLKDWARASGQRYGKVLSDQNLEVSRIYDMLGADTSMMPGTKPGHTFILVDKSGTIIMREDYGPSLMYVENHRIIAAVRKALGA